MKKYVPAFLFVTIITMGSIFSFSGNSSYTSASQSLIDSLRQRYLRSPDTWPRPQVGVGVAYKELGVIPSSPLNVDSLKNEIELGKVLFHDPRLSSSNQISCFSCHAPELNWTDGRRVAIGHDHLRTRRNTPSIENAWAQKNYFWDGRANTLEEQAPHSISNPLEMNQDPAELPQKLSQINGYKELFSKAFGTEDITLDKMTTALATFQKTLVSQKSDFDHFLEGESKRLSDQQVHGFHLFRTKARCVTCHNGPFFTDGNFHNIGMTHYQESNEDLGRYHITMDPKDVGKFKTPSLRNVMRTSPWFHNGLFDDIHEVIDKYNEGMDRPLRKPGQENDPNFPVTTHLLNPLGLNPQEKLAIVEFLKAISTTPIKLQEPVLPQ